MLILKDAGYGGKSLFAEEDEDDDGKLDDEVLHPYYFCVCYIVVC